MIVLFINTLGEIKPEPRSSESGCFDANHKKKTSGLFPTLPIEKIHNLKYIKNLSLSLPGVPFLPYIQAMRLRRSKHS